MSTKLDYTVGGDTFAFFQPFTFNGRAMHIIIERDPEQDEAQEDDENGDETLCAYTYHVYDDETGAMQTEVCFSEEEEPVEAIEWVLESLETDGVLTDVYKAARALAKGAR